jgi:predicted RNA binding protein YcfA (HicA-like mRNA interferase family)
LGKLAQFSGKEVCAILEQHGFIFVRQNGSHLIMQFNDGTIRLSVPVPDHKTVRVGTLSSIIRQSGLPHELFEYQ